MGYIEQIRKLVGRRPLMMVGATLLVHDAEKRLLLLQRSDNRAWGLPGGAVEPGERAEDTVRRDTLEETGLHVLAVELFGVYSGPELFYEYPNGDQVYNISIVFSANPKVEDIHLNREHIDWCFFPFQDLPDEISPPQQPILKEYVARRTALLMK